MKHIVKLSLSNPSHEHVSLRGRIKQQDYITEGRDESEAINRATRHFRTLGFKVHSATIVEQKVELPEPVKEAVDYKALEKPTIARIKSGETKPVDHTNYDVPPAMRKKPVDKKAALEAYIARRKENVVVTEEAAPQYIEEKLTAADPASKWISDFVSSDNPRFSGKSKKERINMALGAYYSAKRMAKNEEVDQKERVKKVERTPDHVIIHSTKGNKVKLHKRELQGVSPKNGEDFAMYKEEVEQIDEQSPAEIKAKYYHDQFNKVKPAKAYDKEGKLVGRYRSIDHAKQMKPGHTYKMAEEVDEETNMQSHFGEEAEQVVEATDPGATKVVNKQIKTKKTAAAADRLVKIAKSKVNKINMDPKLDHDVKQSSRY